MRNVSRWMQTVAILIIVPLAVSLTAVGAPGAAAQDATPAATPALDCSTVEPVDVAFFGFAAANGFAQATWAGVQEAAAEMCATARGCDANVDAATSGARVRGA